MNFSAPVLPTSHGPFQGNRQGLSAVDVAINIARSRGLAGRPAGDTPGDPAGKLWWTPFGEAARAHLCAKVHGSEIGAGQWYEAVRSVAPPEPGLFKALLRLVDILITPVLGEDKGQPALSQTVFWSALIAGFPKKLLWQRLLCTALLSSRQIYTIAVLLWSLMQNGVELSKETLLRNDRGDDDVAVVWRVEAIAAVKSAWAGAYGGKPLPFPLASRQKIATTIQSIMTVAKQQAAAKLAAPMMAPEKPLHVEAIPHVSPKLPKAPKQSTAAHAAASLALHEGLGSWPPGCPPADPASKPWWEKCSRRAREQLSAVLGVEPASAQEWYEAVCASSPDAADLFLALQALVQDLVLPVFGPDQGTPSLSRPCLFSAMEAGFPKGVTWLRLLCTALLTSRQTYTIATILWSLRRQGMGISSEIISGKYAVSDKEAVKWMLDAIRDVRKAWEAASGVGDLPFPLVGKDVMEALEQELMFPSMDVTPQDDAESAQERRVSDGSREKTASEAAVELAVRQHLSTRRIGGEAADPANKAWWTALASAARIHLSVKLQGRPTGPSEWEASLREVAPEQVDLFYALQDLIPKLITPAMGPDTGQPALSRTVLMSAIIAGFPKKQLLWQRLLCMINLSPRVTYVIAVILWSLREQGVELSAEVLSREDSESVGTSVRWRLGVISAVHKAWMVAAGVGNPPFLLAGQAEIKALEQSIFSLAQQHAPSSAESSRPASTPTSQPPMDAQKAQSQPAQATSARATVPSRSEDHQGAGSSVNGGVGGMQRKVGEEGSRERGKPEENAGSDTRVPEEVRAALQGALEQAEEEARRAEEAGDVGGLWRCKRRVAFLVRRSVRIRNRDGAEAAAARLARIGDSIHALFLHSVRGSAPGRSPLGNDRAPSTGPGTRAVGGVTEGESGPPRASIGAGVTAGAPFGGSIAQGVEVGHSAPRAQPALAWTDVASQSASWTAGAQYGAAQHAATQHAAAQHAAAQHAAAQHAAATTTVGATGVAARGEAMARAHSQAKDAGTGAVARGEATVRAARESMSAGIPARESVGDPSLAAAMSLHTEDEEDANMCIVCMEKERCVTLVPCGHRIACLDCAKAWYRKKGTCPYCGGTIQRMTHDEDGWIEFNCWGV